MLKLVSMPFCVIYNPVCQLSDIFSDVLFTQSSTKCFCSHVFSLYSLLVFKVKVPITQLLELDANNTSYVSHSSTHTQIQCEICTFDRFC